MRNDVSQLGSFHHRWRMILIYGLPPQLYGKNGMLRRISHIDGIFQDRDRVYCYNADFTHEKTTLEPALIPLSENVRWFPCRFYAPLHNALFTKLLKECDFLYAHTVHAAQFLYPFYECGKVVSDLHGIAPEEEEMFGNSASSRFYETYERRLVEKSWKVVGVTEKMFDHYHEKYGLARDKFILLPISPEIAPLPRKNHDPASTVIYAGGFQKWQQPEKMFELIRAFSTRLHFLFLSHQEEAFRNFAREKGLEAAVEIRAVGEEDLPREYCRADLGLCLRAPSKVNRVSCPTKLMEYAASGVVPILDSKEIGDFFEMGGDGVMLEELPEALTDASRLERVRQANYAVVESLCSLVRRGSDELKNLMPPRDTLTVSEWAYGFMDTVSRTHAFPTSGIWEINGKHVPCGDICSYEFEAALAYDAQTAPSIFRLPPLPMFVELPVIIATDAHGQSFSCVCSHSFLPCGGRYFSFPTHDVIFLKGILPPGGRKVSIRVSVAEVLDPDIGSALAQALENVLPQGLQSMNGLSFTGMQTHRREKLLPHILSCKTALEIGAQAQPTLLKEEMEIYYLDYATRDEQKQWCQTEEDFARVPETDILVTSDAYSSFLPKETRFDLIIANHVIEHVSSIIGWLQELEGLLNPGGYLFLTVPDKKNSFDKYRQDTPFAHIVADHFAGDAVSDREHLLDIFLNYDSTYVGKEFNPVAKLDRQQLAENFQRDPFIGLHRHVFQSETFLSGILKPLLVAGFLEMYVVKFFPRGDYGEFSVLLRKGQRPTSLGNEEFVPRPPLSNSTPAHIQTLLRWERKLLPEGSSRRRYAKSLYQLARRIKSKLQ